VSAEILLNLIRREIERFHASRYTERHGLVSSYDPKTHLAKVVFQPEAQESGWLPIETGHIGDGWGILIGVTPGSGKSGGGAGGGSPSQNSGDQVIVRYQEGDFESGKIVQRVHSDMDKPPRVEAGEMLFQHKTGSKVFMDKDGKITITDKTGNSSIVMDGAGNITVKAGSSGNIAIQATNVNVTGNLSATGNISSSQNITAAQNITATGTVHGSNI
jgi:phage baseplate assembly protein gpV